MYQLLLQSFNAFLSQGKVPNIWKEVNVTAIHKKNDPLEVANYRLISLFRSAGKVLEKLVHNKYVQLSS